MRRIPRVPRKIFGLVVREGGLENERPTRSSEEERATGFLLFQSERGNREAVEMSERREKRENDRIEERERERERERKENSEGKKEALQRKRRRRSVSEEEEEKEENENGSPGPRADPSVRIVLSVEANDAKTGVHCPRLRGETTKACAATEKGARPRERTCGGSCVHRALDPCIPTFPGKHRPILPRKEERTASFWLGSASAAAAASVLAYIGGYENGKEETNEERTSTRDEKGRERERKMGRRQRTGGRRAARFDF